MARYRVGEKHPIQARLQAAFDALEQQGVSIHIEDYGKVRIHDIRDGQDYYMEDNDSVDYSVDAFPPTFEYRLILEKDS